MTSAVAIAIAKSATAAILDSRGPRSRLCTGARRARSGASSSPTVKRELYSSTNGWPSRPSDSAYERRKPADVRRRRKDVEVLVLERPQVLRADLRALLELREVEILAEAGLAEAGADVEHARDCSRSRTGFRRSLLARADVLQQAVDAQRDERRDAARHSPSTPSTRPAAARSRLSTPDEASDRAVRVPCRGERERVRRARAPPRRGMTKPGVREGRSGR